MSESQGWHDHLANSDEARAAYIDRDLSNTVTPPQRGKSENAEPFYLYATVEKRTTLHVQIPYTAPHPDMVDKEAVALALDRHIENHNGDLPDDVRIDRVSLLSETEPW